ncbi:MAG: pyridoxal phosphate-dependent aminotransferase [Elusimicrobiota bacterium]
MLSELSKKLQPSPTLAITAKAKQMKKEGMDIIGFGAGEPDFDTPDFIKKAAIEALNSGDTKYTPVTGTMELKKAIIDKFRTENRLSYSADQIMVNCGAKHTLFNIIMCTVQAGDEVIIPSPYWVSYTEMVHAAGAKPVIADCMSTGALKLTPEILENCITPDTKLLILNSPSNPAGALYSKEELENIAGIISGTEINIISDEIYEHLIYDTEFNSIAQVSAETKEKTIIVNGVSKAYSMTGWRIGYAAGNSEIISACAKLQSHSTSNPTSFAQAGAIAALSSPASPAERGKMVEEFRKRRDFIYKELSSIPRITVNKPEGAFYIFPYIGEYFSNDIDSSFSFAEKILEKKLVALVPGEGFGAPGYIRLSYASSIEELSKGLARIKEYLEEIRPF